MDDAEGGAARAAASRQLALLHSYTEHLETLMDSWDPRRYSVAAAVFEQMRGEAARLAALTLGWTQVLVTRFEVSQALWDARAGMRNDHLLQCHARHVAALAHYREDCERVASIGRG